MAEIVNLRHVRKRIARDAASRAADANRAKYGRTKAEREAEAMQNERSERDLDAKRLENQ